MIMMMPCAFSSMLRRLWSNVEIALGNTGQLALAT
jgi:hypothetical protein